MALIQTDLQSAKWAAAAPRKPEAEKAQASAAPFNKLLAQAASRPDSSNNKTAADADSTRPPRTSKASGGADTSSARPKTAKHGHSKPASDPAESAESAESCPASSQNVAEMDDSTKLDESVEQQLPAELESEPQTIKKEAPILDGTSIAIAPLLASSSANPAKPRAAAEGDDSDSIAATAPRANSNSPIASPIVIPEDLASQSAESAELNSFDSALKRAAPQPADTAAGNPTSEVPSPFAMPAADHASHFIAAPASPNLAGATPEDRFAEENHPRLVSAVRSELLPNGGTMRLRLDPPELGVLLVRVDVRDGIVNASFQATGDDAARLLSHSLSQLRNTLESVGVGVDKLTVHQLPRDSAGLSQQDDNASQHQHNNREQGGWNDQQRRQLTDRLWRRLRDGADPLDLVA